MKIRTFCFNPFMECTYVVSDEQNNAVIIDCGCFDMQERQQLTDYLQRNNLQPVALLNTHFHLDHQFGNGFIYQQYGLIPYGSEQDLPLLEHIDQQYAMFGLRVSQLSTLMSKPLINPVSDGEQLDFGNMHFIVITTPGHTQGGVCYLLKSEHNDEPDILFSGDTLFNSSIGRTDLPTGDYTTLISSIRNKLMTLPDDTQVYCGHGVKTTIGHERQYNPYI